MNEIRILVVEDEFIIARNICAVLEEFGYVVAGHAYDAESALAMIAKGDIDLVIADINLGKGEDGIALGKRLSEDFGLPHIFLTSHSDTATVRRAKETGPQAFLTKPFNENELFAAVEIAMHKTLQAKKTNQEGQAKPVDSIFLKHNNAYKRVCLKDILFFKSDRVYVEVHMLGRPPIVVRDSLQAMAERLGPEFVRVNRSYLVNVDFVESVEQDILRLAGQPIQLSRQHREDLLGRLGIDRG